MFDLGKTGSAFSKSLIISLRNSKRDGVIQSAPPGHPATFGASYKFCPIVANRFGSVGHHSGSVPVVLIVPINKSIGDFTTVARFAFAQKCSEVKIVRSKTGISYSLSLKTAAIRLTSSGALLNSDM